jgi:dihydrolipoamide dehydrogenase
VTKRIVILGGGPAGYVAALRAAQLGAAVTLVEEREIGGTCLNRGCIPTKAMVAAAERLRAARRDAEFGGVSGAPRVDFAALTARKQAVTVELRGGVEHMLRQRKVDVIAGRGRLVDPRTVEATTAAGEVLRASGDAVIIATGSRPTMLPVFAVDDRRVLTSDGLLELAHVPESLAIVGGGVIGCEFASVFAELGSRVTAVEMLDQLIPGEDRRAAAALQQSFRKAGIETRLKTTVERLDTSSSDAVSLVLADGSTVESQLVLVAVGRSPVSRGLGYEDAGVTVDESGFVVADESQRTMADGVFAAGDVAGPPHRRQAVRPQLHLQPPRGGQLRPERGRGQEAGHRGHDRPRTV